MSTGRFSGKSFDFAAVNRPTAPPSSLGVAGLAAEASTPAPTGASAAFFSAMTESASAAAGPDGAPAGEGETSPAGAISITLSPAVALILSLCQSAKGWSADGVIAKAIVLFAEDIGVPSLVTEIEARRGARHANSESADLHAVPRFARTAPSRFKPFNQGD